MGVDDALHWAALYAALSVRVPTGAGGATRLGRVRRGRLAARPAGAAAARRARGLSGAARRASCGAAAASSRGCGGVAARRAPRRRADPAAGRGDGDARRATRGPRRRLCCGRLATRASSAASARPPASSPGLVRSSSGGFWAHNDSGDAPRIFALGRDGAAAARGGGRAAPSTSTGRTSRSAAGRCTSATSATTWRSGPRSPSTGCRAETGTTSPEKITLRYPDGAHDAEALLVDPRDGTIVIVTKDFGGPPGVYIGRRSCARRGDARARHRPGDHGRRRLRRRPHDRPAQLRPRVRLDPARRRVARPRPASASRASRPRTCSPRARARRSPSAATAARSGRCPKARTRRCGATAERRARAGCRTGR